MTTPNVDSISASVDADVKLVARDVIAKAPIFMDGQNDWIQRIKGDVGNKPHLADLEDIFGDQIHKYVVISTLDKALVEFLMKNCKKQVLWECAIVASELF